MISGDEGGDFFDNRTNLSSGRFHGNYAPLKDTKWRNQP
jgi:hypothetical protein